MAQPLIIQYTNLLHQYCDINADPVQNFLDKHAGDVVFIKRAKALNLVFQLKKELITEHPQAG